MEELSTKEIIDLLENANDDTYKEIFKGVSYTHIDIAKMIGLAPSSVNHWGVKGVKTPKNSLTLLALEIVARKKGYKNLTELVQNCSANPNL